MHRVVVAALCAGMAGVASRAVAQVDVAAVESGATIDEAAVQRVLARPVTVSLQHVTVAQAIKAIGASAKVGIMFSADVLASVHTPVSLTIRDIPLGAALDRVLNGTPLRATVVSNDMLTIKPKGDVQIAAGIVAGAVVDARTKRPLAGATIALDDAKRGVTTEQDGTFRLGNVAPGTHTVRIRLLGYGKVTRSVTVTDGESVTLAVELDVGAATLEQVVVTGTVVPTELKAVPNAITVITAKEIERRGITKITDLFHGDVPGLFSATQGETPYPGIAYVASRGATSINSVSASTQTMKTYIDGVEMADPTYLGLIDPKSIERIEILDGPQASTIYGSSAINGVIQIFTKRGSTPRPQLIAALQTGFIQNNFSSGLAPQHDDMAQLSGVEGHISYNVGGSWVYVGPWTPSMRTSTISGFGGARIQTGPLSVDVSSHRSMATNRQHAAAAQGYTNGQVSGLYVLPTATADQNEQQNSNSSENLGATVTFAPVSWWSNAFTVGTDRLNSNSRILLPQYTYPADSSVSLTMSPTNKLTFNGSSTLQLPLAPWAKLVVTGGGDGSNTVSSYSRLDAVSLNNGNGQTTVQVTQTATHNRGAFVQGQFGVADQLFLTYGLRGEWNPNFGASVSPNVVPRYGVVYTRELGAVTAKVRASYGHSTRPPDAGVKDELSLLDWGGPYFGSYYTGLYGNAVAQVGNKELLPEEQRGGEGGLELYLGNRASLVVTRYNQTVNNLITIATVDSVDMLPSQLAANGCAVWQCPFRQWEWLNIGNIRNQGWETQGTVVTGPMSFKGTYSWNKSRIIGITERWRKYTYGTYTVGAPFAGTPEHTWALESVYGRNGTSVSLNLHGQGFLYTVAPDYSSLGSITSRLRLDVTSARMRIPPVFRAPMAAYSMADLNAAQRISQTMELLLQVQNLSNVYHNDVRVDYATMGRQTKAGVRIHM